MRGLLVNFMTHAIHSNRATGRWQPEKIVTHKLNVTKPRQERSAFGYVLLEFIGLVQCALACGQTIQHQVIDALL